MHTPHMSPRSFPSQPDDCSTTSRPCIKLQSHLHPRLSSALAPDLEVEKWSGRVNPCLAWALLCNYVPSKAGHPLRHLAKVGHDSLVKRWKDFRVAELPCSPRGAFPIPWWVLFPLFLHYLGGNRLSKGICQPRSDEVGQGRSRSAKVSRGQTRSAEVKQSQSFLTGGPSVLILPPPSLTSHLPPCMCVYVAHVCSGGGVLHTCMLPMCILGYNSFIPQTRSKQPLLSWLLVSAVR